MILLDTNICIYIINAKPAEVLNRFQEYRMGEIGLCSVVAAELAFGVAKSGSARNRQALEMFLAPLLICRLMTRPSGLMAIYGLIWNAAAPRLARWTP
jgi:predicted nucleic acid-binding protein